MGSNKVEEGREGGKRKGREELEGGVGGDGIGVRGGGRENNKIIGLKVHQTALSRS